jgi:hypothetical protein
MSGDNGPEKITVQDVQTVQVVQAPSVQAGHGLHFRPGAWFDRLTMSGLFFPLILSLSRD